MELVTCQPGLWMGPKRKQCYWPQCFEQDVVELKCKCKKCECKQIITSWDNSRQNVIWKKHKQYNQELIHNTKPSTQN